MGKKGEDVKHLFAHLGLDPGSYRDLKSGEAGDQAKAERTSDKATKASRRQSAATKPAPAAADVPEAGVPPRMTDVAADVEETATPADEPVSAEPPAGEHIAAEPDRWSLLAMLGEGNLPVADLPEPEVVANMAFGARNATVSDTGVEADTPRLRRAGSLSALLRGAGEAAAVDDNGSQPPSARVETHVADEDPADEPDETVDETDEAATVEHIEAAEPEPAESAVMEPDDTREEPPPARRRTSTGAIGKLMDRLRETPIERHIEPARLKLNYERREKAVVAEKPVDQDIATVFGRLKRSRVD